MKKLILLSAVLLYLSYCHCQNDPITGLRVSGTAVEPLSLVLPEGDCDFFSVVLSNGSVTESVDYSYDFASQYPEYGTIPNLFDLCVNRSGSFIYPILYPFNCSQILQGIDAVSSGQPACINQQNSSTPTTPLPPFSSTPPSRIINPVSEASTFSPPLILEVTTLLPSTPLPFFPDTVRPTPPFPLLPPILEFPTTTNTTLESTTATDTTFESTIATDTTLESTTATDTTLESTTATDTTLESTTATDTTLESTTVTDTTFSTTPLPTTAELTTTPLTSGIFRNPEFTERECAVIRFLLVNGTNAAFFDEFQSGFNELQSGEYQNEEQYFVLEDNGFSNFSLSIVRDICRTFIALEIPQMLNGSPFNCTDVLDRYFSSPRMPSCMETIEENLNMLEELQQTGSVDIGFVANSLEGIVASSQALTFKDSQQTADILQMATNDLIVNDQRAQPEVVNSILQTVGQLINTLDQQPQNSGGIFQADPVQVDETEVRSSLLFSLRNVVQSIELPENQTSLVLTTNNIAVNIIQPSARGLATIRAAQSEDNDLIVTTVNFRNPNNPSRRSIRATMNSYTNPTLFYVIVLEDGNQLDTRQNTTQVVTVGGRNIRNASTTFSITMNDVTLPPERQPIDDTLMTQLTASSIKMWNFNTLRWIEPDCIRTNNGRTSPSYSCNNFASLTILFTSIEVPSNFALAIFSYIGSGLSILFLLVTVCIYLYFADLRNKKTTFVLINICCSLFVVYLVYVVGINRTESFKGCDFVAFLLHYATLCTWAWMSINSYDMYAAFIKVSMNRNTKGKIVKYFLAYGLTFLIAFWDIIISVVIVKSNKDEEEDIFNLPIYRLPNACWLQGHSLYWGFLLPVGLGLVFNFTIFVLITVKLWSKEQSIRSSAKKRNTRDRLLNAVTLCSMMGLTWIFGYFILVSENINFQTAMQWLFTVFNSLQGLAIFLLYCVRNRKIRLVWLPTSTYSSSSTKGTNLNISSGGKSKSSSEKNTDTNV